jgi:hypothetical protein
LAVKLVRLGTSDVQEGRRPRGAPSPFLMLGFTLVTSRSAELPVG